MFATVLKTFSISTFDLCGLEKGMVPILLSPATPKSRIKSNNKFSLHQNIIRRRMIEYGILILAI